MLYFLYTFLSQKLFEIFLIFLLTIHSWSPPYKNFSAELRCSPQNPPGQPENRRPPPHGTGPHSPRPSEAAFERPAGHPPGF